MSRTKNDQVNALCAIGRKSTDSNQWTHWWQQNQRAFQAAGRYRHGKPFSLTELTENLANPSSPCNERQLTHLELIIHSKRHIGFEPDWFISDQLAAIKQWQANLA